jgi:hypothetical protein
MPIQAALWPVPPDTFRPEALGSPAGYAVPPGPRLLWPHPRFWLGNYGGAPPAFHARGTAQDGRARRSPIYSAWLSDHAASPTPVAHSVRVVVATAAAMAFASGVRARRPHQVISRLQSSLYATAWPFASPPQEDVYTRAFACRVAPNKRRV